MPIRFANELEQAKHFGSMCANFAENFINGEGLKGVEECLDHDTLH